MLQATRSENIFYNEVDSYWFFRMKMSFGATEGRLGDLVGESFSDKSKRDLT